MITIDEYTSKWDSKNAWTRLRAGTTVKFWEDENGNMSSDGREVDGFMRAVRAAGLELDFLRGTSKTSTYKLVRTSDPKSSGYRR